jgi:hypothetical protein
MNQQKKKNYKPGLTIRVEINEDIEFELNKLCNKRKITPSKLINEIMQEWLEDLDMSKFEKKGK